ncbi:MAG: NAD(P)H-binding protein [Euryarchaeota archaeon]|nr:NAD(P)H-binding protein [Euryarchaeota archaeon]MDE2044161.1 NAD(P)H-binding protein [Thermoplasmata archaeon]
MPAHKVLLMGGGAGVVGSGVLAEIAGRYEIRSYHRTPAPSERGKVEFVSGDVGEVGRFPELVRGVDSIVNVVWYRQPGPDRLFARTEASLRALVSAAQAAGVERFVQISLPPATSRLESRTPYLYHKRAFEKEMGASGLKVTLLQPSAIFAPQDRLIHVMLDLMQRHRRFPLFGDGGYHLSPIWHQDVGWLVGEALEDRLSGTVLAGGPQRYTYLELLELLQRYVPQRVKLVRVSLPTGRLAVQFFNALGWHVLYTYEYDWLVSDLLGFAAPSHPGREFRTLESFLEEGRHA